LPKDAIYYFTQADSPRAMTADQLLQKATSHGLHGKSYSTVEEAKKAAITAATNSDLIYIGGSMYILAEALMTDLD
ncbi:MAG: bifunctional folylpolyglutamate synthase/dihydrofolate synthase, partial [Sodaliphilus sp.]|nr:bifunctional folylpolyglutamate synthase/dihydrofolate synthase [Sodaliphilus sp.]